MLTLQIGKPGDIGVMSCHGQGGLGSLSALVYFASLGLSTAIMAFNQFGK